MTGSKSLKFVVKVSYKLMKPIDDNYFLFGTTLELEEKNMVIAEEIKMVRINFTSYQIDHVLRDESITDKII